MLPAAGLGGSWIYLAFSVSAKINCDPACTLYIVILANWSTEKKLRIPLDWI